MYKLTENPDLILRLSDNAFIPKGHRFWQEYEEWLEAGNIPEDFKTEAEIRAEAEREVKTKRDSLLQASDFAVMPDYPLKGAKLTALKQYRQALRDITSQEGYPLSVTWPEYPL